MAKKGKDII